MRYNKWKKIKFGEIAEINPRIPLSRGVVAKKIAMADIKEFTRKIEGYEYAEYKSGSKFENNDTLFARITPCLENGKTAFVDILEDEEIAFGSTEFFVLRAKPGLADPKFIFYLSISNHFRDTAIQSMTGTSGRQRAQREALLEFKINMPSLKEQINIGKILSLFDEKIELNNSIISNLEELAQTLFKRWFVDFEFPNDEGKPYKSSGGIMVESELGMIPKGWKIGKINDIGKVVGGGTPSKRVKNYYCKDGISWLTPKDLSRNKLIYQYKGEIDITETGFKKSSAQLLPKNTILFSSRAPIGYVAIAGKETTTNQGFKSIVPFHSFPTEYIYCLLKYLIPFIKSNASGSTFKEISGTGMKNIEIIIPNKKVLKNFHITVNNKFSAIKEREQENETLKKIRDTLLPKLLSGEIELPDDLEVTDDARIS